MNEHAHFVSIIEKLLETKKENKEKKKNKKAEGFHVFFMAEIQEIE